MGRKQLVYLRIPWAAAKTSLHRDRDRDAEEQNVHRNRERGPALNLGYRFPASKCSSGSDSDR